MLQVTVSARLFLSDAIVFVLLGASAGLVLNKHNHLKVVLCQGKTQMRRNNLQLLGVL
jgi:hypothetical protein